MDKNTKIDVVEQIKELLNNSTAVYLVDYSKISVQEINEIRREFIKEDVNYKVFKNTLFKRAAEEVGGYDDLFGKLEGMTGFAFVGDNFVAPAKIIKKINSSLKKLTFKGCVIESAFYDADQLEVLASMPTKEEIMASIVGSVAAPASGIVGAISAVLRDVVSLVDEISKKKAA